jgi:Kdo2-lipid IVA lauroyltransferase/acyltransferase
MPHRRIPNTRPDWVRRHLIWPLEAIAFLLVLALLAILPRQAAAWTGGALTGFFGSRFSQQHARAVRRNLAVAFPDLDEHRRRGLQQEIWRHFGRVLSTYSHLPAALRRPDRGGAIDVHGAEHLADAAREGPFLLVGAHFGHWELAGCYVAMAGHKVTALYTPESNPYVDGLIYFLRQKASAESKLIARGPKAVRQLIEALRERRNLFIIVDQRVDDGEWVPFFGRPAQTTTTPARLARRFGCAILPARAVLLPKGRYRLSFESVMRPDPTRDAESDVLAITARLNHIFEGWIREDPGQWLCMKRRWPKERRLQREPEASAAAHTPPPQLPAAVD